eukprot:CAMPEP_0174362534 /NCGR_PEP_ID=MMETSP0811_2-20130205/64766_1 /TAXON_ID=73025 ORGANISM="Eutreptiella gymnastica-like, Strain CCMP1594" /NCGR_SAMPLE_ID=MMETSP0811_2 /ASSEMBLY_ACC=CAM_ASM_000667 /LENGTH=122 /DNA_ID=CAMNT_0015500309 /DNA_START=90 /DNA_END=458 /DNA_ORIENTATION=-
MACKQYCRKAEEKLLADVVQVETGEGLLDFEDAVIPEKRQAIVRLVRVLSKNGPQIYDVVSKLIEGKYKLHDRKTGVELPSDVQFAVNTEDPNVLKHRLFLGGPDDINNNNNTVPWKTNGAV